MPLDRFIDIVCTKNLDRLIKYGTPPLEELQQAWDQIYTEYVEESQSVSFRRMFALTKEIGVMQSKQLAINICLRVLGKSYSKKCVDILRGFGYRYAYNPDEPDQYAKDLLTVATRSRSLEITIKQKTAEYENLMQTYGDKEIDRSYFTRLLVELSKYMGFRIDPAAITVSEFTSIQHSFVREIESQQTQLDRIKHKGHGTNR